MTQPHGERSGETTLVVRWQLAGPPPIRVTVRPMLICLRVQRQRPDDGREASTFLFRFEQAEVLIGRSEAVEVRLPDPAVSLVHARILRRRGGKLVLVDDGSTNGTYVDGVRVEVGRARRLRAGSRIVAGPYVIDVLDPSSQASATATGRADTASYARQMVLEVMNKLAGDVPTSANVSPERSCRSRTLASSRGTNSSRPCSAAFSLRALASASANCSARFS